MFHAGQQIGLYTLIEKIGKGSFGEVWMAEKRTQFVTKRVAIKLPHNEILDFEAIRQEATLWEEASGHPNVLPIIDADVYDGQVAIVSEYAGGGSLADRLKNEERIPVAEAVELTIGILNGLEYLHSKKIIHRDIKPANILLQGNMPRLADFGISRAIETSTISSVVVGTESYMSPEAFDGKRNVQTDIWSVGVVLYQLLSGRLPFPQKRASEVMYAILLKEPEPLPDDIPPQLQEIVFKALEKDKNPEEVPKRYQSSAEMRDDLNIFLQTFHQPLGPQETTQAVSPETAPELTEETAPVLSRTDSEIPTRVKLRIPLPDSQSWHNLRQLLSKKEIFPFVTLILILGFLGIAWMFFKGRGQTLIENSNLSTPVVTAPANTLSNSGNQTNPNSAARNISPKALEYVNQGYKLLQEGQFDRAIQAYTKAIKIDPDDYALYNDRGLIYYAQRKFDKAIADFDKSIEINPASLTYNNRGVAYQDKGDKEKAIADYRKALELDPTNEQANKNLNEILK
jgi:serine/threonine protein kinase